MEGENPFAGLSDKEKLDKRRELIVDIIHAEVEYCAELEDFHEYFIVPLLQAGDKGTMASFLQPQDAPFAQTLNAFNQIVDISVRLSKSLQSANSGELFAKALKAFASSETMNVYTHYIQLLPQAMEFLSSLNQSNSQLLDQFMEVNCLPEGMTVDGCFQAPATHFLTYVEQVKQFGWLTPANRQSELSPLNEALDVLLRATQGNANNATYNVQDNEDHAGGDDDSSPGASDDEGGSDDDGEHNNDKPHVTTGRAGADSDDEDPQSNLPAPPPQAAAAADKHAEPNGHHRVDETLSPPTQPAQDNNDQLIALETEVIRLKDALSAAERTISDQSNELDLKRKRIETLTADIAKSTVDCTQTQNKFTELNRQHTEILRENEELTEEVEKLQLDIGNLKEQQQMALAQAQQPLPEGGRVSFTLGSFSGSSEGSSGSGSPIRGRSNSTGAGGGGGGMGMGMGGSRRKSMAVSMECKNSLGYFNDDIDEDAIIRDNLQSLIRSAGLRPDENKLYVQMIEFMAAEFHLCVSLKNDVTTRATWTLVKGDLAVVCRQLISRIFTFLMSFVNDTHDEPLAALPYPLQWLLKCFPDTAERGSGREWLPIHWALALDPVPPISEIRLLYEYYGTKTALTQPVSPLSVAVSKAHPSLETVTFLVEECPSLATRTDADGAFALMHACSCNTETDVVEFLFETHEEAATTPDNFGCYSIHYACFSGYLPVIQYLLHTCPFLASQRSGNGAFPLHDAVQNWEHGGIELVRCVYNAHPDAVSQPDNNGALPLHHAAKAANLEVVQLIHRAYPQV
jgi:archaellum component FlaC